MAGSIDPYESPDLEPVPGRARRRRSRRRHHGVAAVVVTLLLVVAATAAGAIIVVADTPEGVLGCRLTRESPQVFGADTVLTAAGGTRLGVIPTSQNHELVPLTHISPWLREATVDVEDRRFWQHGALDPVGVARSALADLVAGSPVQGASTLTQQLARNRYLDGQQMTLGRKLHEACLAIQLFARWPRRRILESYLNTVYYGQHARGVQAASWTYFSRPASHVTLAQAALLAGLPQAPTYDNPFQHPQVARARRAEVLAAMRRARHISAAQLRAALAAPLGLRPSHRYTTIRSGTFFAAARDELVRRVGAGRARHGGLHVQTTLSPRLEHAAQQAIGSWINAPAGPSAALVAIDPHDGAVLAAAARTPGVRGVRFNLATQSRRQAGSAFKTFTLATALEQGISLHSVWNGPPSLTIPDRRCLNANGPWVVHNFADESSGTMDLIGGIAHSVNTIFAQVAVRVGPASIVRTARRMGVRSPLVPVCSITLGPEGVSPLDMATAFATLADGGVHHAPRFLRSITTPAGTQLLGRPRGDRALPPGVASEVTYALSAVIRGGTGTAADIGRPASGKTGTAENSADAWFCGYVPQLAACVWMGHSQAEIPMASVDGFAPVVGGGVPARIWHDFMTRALAGTPALPMPQVSSVAPAPPAVGSTIASPGSTTATVPAPTTPLPAPAVPAPGHG